MKKLIKKSVLVGIGILKFTKEKAVEYSKQLEKQGVMTKKEAESFVKDLIKKSNDAQKKMSQEIDKKVKIALKKSNKSKSDSNSSKKSRPTKNKKTSNNLKKQSKKVTKNKKIKSNLKKPKASKKSSK